MEKVSALIISKNEAHVIERCVRSLAWADEILVIDAESTDGTPELARKAGARVITRPWSGFREQRMFALENAQNNWVLVVDSDEECTPELANRVRQLLSNPPLRAYKVRRQEYFLGKPIHYGIWNPSYQDRLFDRRGVYYKNEIHEYPIFAAAPGRIEEPLLHWPDFSPEKFLEKMNKYTSIEARDRVNQGMRTNPFRMVMAFPAMFLKNYFYYSAYRDGIHGFAISILEGISRAVRHIKIWRYQNESVSPQDSRHG
jgi:(heptosyl)LPS beta-1,4-glucosyltransferase